MRKKVEMNVSNETENKIVRNLSPLTNSSSHTAISIYKLNDPCSKSKSTYQPRKYIDVSKSLKCSYVQFFEEFDVQNFDNYQRTINNIKKTRKELVDEYKNMMNTAALGSTAYPPPPPSPLNYETVLFGQKVDFKSPYATKLKRPTFGQTFQKIFLKK